MCVESHSRQITLFKSKGGCCSVTSVVGADRLCAIAEELVVPGAACIGGKEDAENTMKNLLSRAFFH